MAALRHMLRLHSHSKNALLLQIPRTCHQTTDRTKPIEDALRDQGHNPSNPTNLRKITTTLLENGIDMRDLIPYFTKRPELINTQNLHWEKTIEFVKSYGYTAHDALSLVGQNPGILSLSNEYLITMFICLQNQGINSEKLLQFVQDNPHVLRMSPEEVSEKMGNLRQHFSSKDCKKLVNSCPNILCESDEEIEHKIEYIVRMCGAGHAQIVNSQALKHSFEHIYLRHEFLRRTGHYVRPKPKAKAELCKNPSLKVMFGADDEYFAVNVAKVSLEEFYVFCALPQHERAMRNFVRRLEFGFDDNFDEDGDEVDESD